MICMIPFPYIRKKNSVDSSMADKSPANTTSPILPSLDKKHLVIGALSKVVLMVQKRQTRSENQEGIRKTRQLELLEHPLERP